MPIPEALKRLGAQVGLDMVAVADGEFQPGPRDLALVVAGHGREELPALRTGLEAGLPYVGLVASRRRGQGVIGELRSDGVPDELLARIDTPAGVDIGARTPEEIAVSILARIIEVRRSSRAVTAVDPVCGMTVAVGTGTPSLEHDGETFHFCCEGCKEAFERQHA
jgi:xanthine dehydrogenase accessory factor